MRVPAGWRTASVATVCSVNPRTPAAGLSDISPVTFIPMEGVAEDARGIVLRQTARLSEVRQGHPSFQEGDVLFAKITPSMENGKVAIATDLTNGRGFGSTEFFVLRPGEGVTSEWLFYWVLRHEFRMDATAYFSGTAGQRRVHRTYFDDSQMPIPPANEQTKITAVLSRLDQAIDQTHHAIEKARAVKRGLMQGLLTRGIGHIKFKKTEIGEIPEGWKLVTLGDLSSDSAFGPRFSSDHYAADGNVSVLRTTDIDDDGRVNYASMPRAQLRLSDFDAHLLQPNDLVITRSGTCGIAAVFEPQPGPVLPGAFLIRFRLNGKVEPHFLAAFINKDSTKSLLQNLSTGAVQKNLNTPTLKGIRIPLPPLAEQRNIVKALESAEKILQIELTRRDRLTTLKTGLMQDLLTGRVRFPEFAGGASV